MEKSMFDHHIYPVDEYISSVVSLRVPEYFHIHESFLFFLFFV